jgi:REP element-mobilizing transposase RayT
VPHDARPALASRFPVHITVRLREGLPHLRNFELGKVLRGAFVRGCDRGRFRICHFAVLGNHIHLICEAADAQALSSGVAGWKVRVARNLNREWDRRGEVFEDRYHEEILRTPTQVRNALLYVLQNARRHGERGRGWVGGVDPFSSGRYFDGWRDAPDIPPPDPGEPLPVAPATTFLLTTGWRQRGLIGVGELPAAASRHRGAAASERRQG